MTSVMEGAAAFGRGSARTKRFIYEIVFESADAEMAAIRTSGVFQALNLDMAKMSAAAMDSRRPFEDMIGVMAQLGMLGVSTEQDIAKLSDSIVNLSVVSSDSLAQVSSSLMHMAISFQISGREVETFTQKMLSVSSVFGTSTQGMAQSAQQLQLLGRAFGLSSEQIIGLGAGLERFTGSSARAAQVTSTFAGMLNQSFHYGSSLNALLVSMGADTTLYNRLVHETSVLGQYRIMGEFLIEQQKTLGAAQLLRAEASANMTQQQVEALQTLAMAWKEVEAATTAATKAPTSDYLNYLASFNSALADLRGTWHNLLRTLGEQGFLESATRLVQVLTQIVKALDAVAETTAGRVVIQILAAVAVFGMVAAAVISATAAFAGLSLAIGGLAAITALTLPELALLAGAFVLLWTAVNGADWDAVKRGAAISFQWLVDRAYDVTDQLDEWLAPLGQTLINMGEIVKKYAGEAAQALAGPWAYVSTMVSEAFDDIVDSVENGADLVVSGFNRIREWLREHDFGDWLARGFGNVGDAVSDMMVALVLKADRLMEGVKGFFDKLSTGLSLLPADFAEAMTELYDSVRNTASGLGESLAGVAEDVFARAEAVGNIIASWASGVASATWDGVLVIADRAAEAFSVSAETVRTLASLLWAGVAESVGSLADDVAAGFDVVWSGLVHGAKAAWSEITSGIVGVAQWFTNVFDSAAERMGALVESFTSGVAALFDDVVAGLRRVYDRIAEALRDIAGAIKNFGAEAKKALFGSGFLHIEEGASEAIDAMDAFSRSLAGPRAQLSLLRAEAAMPVTAEVVTRHVVVGPVGRPVVVDELPAAHRWDVDDVRRDDHVPVGMIGAPYSPEPGPVRVVVESDTPRMADWPDFPAVVAAGVANATSVVYDKSEMLDVNFKPVEVDLKIPVTLMLDGRVLATVLAERKVELQVERGEVPLMPRRGVGV